MPASDLISAGPFRLVHRGVGGLYQAFDDLPSGGFNRRAARYSDNQS